MMVESKVKKVIFHQMPSGQSGCATRITWNPSIYFFRGRVEPWVSLENDTNCKIPSNIIKYFLVQTEEWICAKVLVTPSSINGNCFELILGGIIFQSTFLTQKWFNHRTWSHILFFVHPSLWYKSSLTLTSSPDFASMIGVMTWIKIMRVTPVKSIIWSCSNYSLQGFLNWYTKNWRMSLLAFQLFQPLVAIPSKWSPKHLIQDMNGLSDVSLSLSLFRLIEFVHF